MKLRKLDWQRRKMRRLSDKLLLRMSVDNLRKKSAYARNGKTRLKGKG